MKIVEPNSDGAEEPITMSTVALLLTLYIKYSGLLWYINRNYTFVTYDILYYTYDICMCVEEMLTGVRMIILQIKSDDVNNSCLLYTSRCV